MTFSMPVCCIGGCDTEVPGLDDGIPASSRDGVACMDCWDYKERHMHWPDEDPDTRCLECIIDDGGVRHDCPDQKWDVVYGPDDLPGRCDDCGQAVEAERGTA